MSQIVCICRNCPSSKLNVKQTKNASLPNNEDLIKKDTNCQRKAF